MIKYSSQNVFYENNIIWFIISMIDLDYKICISVPIYYTEIFNVINTSILIDVYINVLEIC